MAGHPSVATSKRCLIILRKYWGKKLDGIRIDPLGETAIAFFQFHSTVKLRGREELYRPSGHVTMLFRHTRAGWRVIHYHESAPAAAAHAPR
jgi:hypothetical protein